VLVDRFWPRGISKEKANFKWMKEIPPTPDLIKWFGHDEKKWGEFGKRYKRQLSKNVLAKELKKRAKKI